jgi:hypothetical protein
MSLRLVFAAAFVSLAAPAAACSMAPGYRVPTTLELVEEADAIVLARVDTGVPAGPPYVEGRGLVLAPLVLLKGDALPGQIEMSGWLEAGEARATRSDPAELVEANPDAFDGGCNRYIFARGMTLLLFLSQKDGKTRQISYPFARTAEDVVSPDARWVALVREYVAVAALPKAARDTQLAARRDALRSKPDADSQAIAAEIDRALTVARRR